MGSLVHYRNGTGGVEKNDELARHWLERGAELGNLDAQEIFGFDTYDSRGYDARVKWFERAAAQGHPSPSTTSGCLYEKATASSENIPNGGWSLS